MDLFQFDPPPVIQIQTSPAEPKRVVGPKRPEGPRAIHVSGYERTRRDFYATPSWVTEALLRHIQFRGPVWEPCCGDGAMTRVLEDHGYNVVSTGLVDRGFGTAGIDFLACSEVPTGCRSIITNPPYGDTGSQVGQSRSPAAMLGFLRHAMMLTAATRGSWRYWSACNGSPVNGPPTLYRLARSLPWSC